MNVIDRVRDAVETELGEIGADREGYDGVPDDHATLNPLPRLPEETLAGGLHACVREIAERMVLGLVV